MVLNHPGRCERQLPEVRPCRFKEGGENVAASPQRDLLFLAGVWSDRALTPAGSPALLQLDLMRPTEDAAAANNSLTAAAATAACQLSY